MKYKCLEKLGLNNDNKEDKKKSKIMSFVNKILMAIFLGLVSLIIMEYSPKFKTFMQNEVLNKNISFGFIGSLYNKYFGKVLPQEDNSIVEVFNEKLVFTNKEKYQDGYNLTVTNNYLVPSIENGVVVYIGEKEGLGKIITIEGEDNTTITYGNIKNTSLKLYDYLAKGKYLGEVNNNILYISVMKDGKEEDISAYLS